MAPNSDPTRKMASSAAFEPSPARRVVGRLRPALAAFFALFLSASAFSIAVSQIALGVALFLFVVIVALEGRLPFDRRLRSLYLVWGAYVAWLVISALFSPTPLSSLAGLREEWLIAILPIGLYLMRGEAVRNRLLTALAAGVLLAAIYGMIQHFTGQHWFKDQGLHSAAGNFRLSGNFSHPLTYGYYVVTTALFFLCYTISTRSRQSDRRRWLFFAATAAAGLVAAALSNSRGPLLALGIGLAVMGALSRKIRYTLIGVILVLALGAVLAPGLASEFTKRVEDDLNLDNRMGRLYIWGRSLTLIEEHPVVGVGPNNFGPAYNGVLPPDAHPYEEKSHAHNDFLNIAANSGLPALAFFLGFWSLILRRLWRQSRDPRQSPQSRALSLAALIAALAFLTGSLTEAAFADEELRQMITALWAFGLAGGVDETGPGCPPK